MADVEYKDRPLITTGNLGTCVKDERSRQLHEPEVGRNLLTNNVILKDDDDVKKLRRFKTLLTLLVGMAFFGLGMASMLLGTTLLDLQFQVQSSFKSVSIALTTSGAGYLLGSVFGGVCADRFNRELVLGLNMVSLAIVGALLPWFSILGILILISTIWGLTKGSVDTGGNVLVVNVWGNKSGPYMQAVHFCFAFGAAVSPLFTGPFLMVSPEASPTNISLTPTVSSYSTQTLPFLYSDNGTSVQRESDSLSYLLNTGKYHIRPKMEPTQNVYGISQEVSENISEHSLLSLPKMSVSTDYHGLIKDVNASAETYLEFADSSESGYTEVQLKIWIPYTIVSIYNLLVSILFFIAFCCGNRKCCLERHQTKSTDETAESPEHVANPGARRFRVILLLIVCAFTFIYLGFETLYGGFLYSFAMKSDLPFTPVSAAYLNSAFWGSYAAFRFVAIFLTIKITPRTMLTMDVIGMLISSSLLAVFGNKSIEILWLASILLGISMASAYPSMLSWTEIYIKLTGKTTAAIVVAASSSDSLLPFVMGFMMTAFGIDVLMYTVLALAVGATASFICMQAFASKHGERYKLDSVEEKAVDIDICNDEETV
ncbi:sodium-dependent glucose transporter 1B-like [Glandiceps talaboti]